MATSEDDTAARNLAKRERLVTYLVKSRTLQRRMKFVLAGGGALAVAFFIALGPTWFLGTLVLTGIVAGCGRHGHGSRHRPGN